MNCPRCGKRTTVTDSRNGKDAVIRVRKCSCGTVFKTVEYMDNTEETDMEYKELKREAQQKHLLKVARKEQK